MAKVGMIVMPAACLCNAEVSLCHRRNSKCSTSFFFSFSFFISFQSQFDACKQELKKQPAADAFSNAFLEKSALETQYIVHYMFQVNFIIGTSYFSEPSHPQMSLNFKDDESLLSRDIEDFLFLSLCHHLRTPRSTNPFCRIFRSH